MTVLVIPGRPAEQGLTWWLLSDGGGVPPLEVVGPGGAGAAIAVCPLDPARMPDAFLVGTTGLQPDSAYTLRARPPGRPPVEASSRTLPGAGRPGQTLTIALGSCFSTAQDKGALTSAYPPARFGPGRDPIHLRLLLGDQIYMDLDPSSGGPIMVQTPNPWDRYGRQWRDVTFAQFMSASPNVVMADDHEYWNDYPHGNVWLTWAVEGTPAVAAFDPAFGVFQAALNIAPAAIAGAAANPAQLAALLADAARTFELTTSPVPIFVLDTRTRRTRYDDNAPAFSRPQWLAAAVNWLAGLQAPGVLVVSQPLVEKAAGWIKRATHTMTDVNLPDYPQDFATLWDAILAAPRDVLVLSGDIHWNRLYRVNSAVRPQHTVYELIASPLARIKQGGDVSEVKEAQGKVEWTNGNAGWLRLFAENGKTSYVTATFTAGTPVIAEVSLWGPPAGSAPVAQATFKLN